MGTRNRFNSPSFGFDQGRSTHTLTSLMAGAYEPEVGRFRSYYLLPERYTLAQMGFIGSADRPEEMIFYLGVFQR
jgi:hypothetical protein